MPDCANCLAAIRNDSFVEKFGLLYKLKCPERTIRENRECREFSTPSRTGRK